MNQGQKKKRTPAMKKLPWDDDYTGQASRLVAEAVADLRVALMLLRGSRVRGPAGQVVRIARFARIAQNHLETAHRQAKDVGYFLASLRHMCEKKGARA